MSEYDVFTIKIFEAARSNLKYMKPDWKFKLVDSLLEKGIERLKNKEACSCLKHCKSEIASIE